jgi:maltose-binding protein MalE
MTVGMIHQNNEYAKSANHGDKDGVWSGIQEVLEFFEVGIAHATQTGDAAATAFAAGQSAQATQAASAQTAQTA